MEVFIIIFCSLITYLTGSETLDKIVDRRFTYKGLFLVLLNLISLTLFCASSGIFLSRILLLIGG